MQPSSNNRLDLRFTLSRLMLFVAACAGISWLLVDLKRLAMVIFLGPLAIAAALTPVGIVIGAILLFDLCGPFADWGRRQVRRLSGRT